MILRVGRLYVAAWLLMSVNANAGITVVWTPSNDGKTMAYQVTSADAAPAIDPQTRIECGSLLQSPQCYVRIRTTTKWAEKNSVSLKGRQTYASVLAAWMKTSPRGVISNWNETLQNPCVLFDVEGNPGGATIGDSCTGTATPPPEPPKPPVSCFLSGNVYLQHGPVADDDVTGARSSTAVRIYCTAVARVKVRALSSLGSDSAMVDLRADGSLKSLLSVDGYVGNGGVQLDVPGAGGREVTFTSLLVATGVPAPGDFFGSAVAVVDIL